jgi:predicted AlkP superfamily pyrophosphatase or phosphodiesterase
VLVAVLAAPLALVASAAAPGQWASRESAAQALVLFLAVDGFPQDQLLKYYDQYGDGGFKLLLDRGTLYSNSHYSHATTYMGVGHATLLSCAHPYKHAIIGNDWLDKATMQRVYSTEDSRHVYLDEETKEHQGT